MGRSTVHYTDSKTNNILKALHNKLRPAGTPVQRVEYIIELLLLRIFEVKLKREDEFKRLRKLFATESGNEKKLFYYLQTVGSERILTELNQNLFPFYANILNQAHKVIKGNLKDRVQDQLVLIQEVFANSNFTNNVQSGNLEEIVNLVAEIDEDRLLKTDLLGDAIESSLSEIGGTKDIGLFRTPDHVRQFMVAMLQPKITDSIFDPACGTGGFLFDSFGFVTESISHDGEWPGPKAHPQLQDWFQKYFKKNPAPMPTVEQTHQFYRSGIYGIEYLGMIRKMAAVNFYIRGLNPYNIEQGDSLAKFNKELQFKDTFSIVLANPPFGAERDQKAYPNVWEEFARESETTILFVKLMLDALKPGGHCSVVVSEGFLIWEQTSAKTLRHMLLTNANLQAVIGLPQGVFVSKNGQGPKTSILVFEKGKPTKNVWFYNIENDGFTKGANRTPVEGCQMIVALELYHKYVKHGKKAPETRNSFSLSVDWLTVVDPRIKEKIRNETTTNIEQKKEKAKTKLIGHLDKKLKDAKKAKARTKASRFGRKEYEAEIYKFECTWQQKLRNEIAKRIDKVHIYSLNSSTYRSNLTKKQLQEWDEAVSHHKPETSIQSLDVHYENLSQVSLKNAIDVISCFDPKNEIEIDILREYLGKYLPKELADYPNLDAIDRIINGKRKCRLLKLEPYINQISKKNSEGDDLPIMLVSKNHGMMLSDEYFSNRQTGRVYSEDLSGYKIIKKFQFAYSGIHANEGAIGYLKDYDVALISGIYRVFDIDMNMFLPDYLEMILKSKRALEYYKKATQGAIDRRTNLSFEFFSNLTIPVPSIQEQQLIMEKVKLKQSKIKNLKKRIAAVEEEIAIIDDHIW